MDSYQLEYKIQLFAHKSLNFLAEFSHDYAVLIIAIFSAVLVFIGISPLQSSSQTSSVGLVCIGLRKVIFRLSLVLICIPALMSFLIVISNDDHNLLFALDAVITYYGNLLTTQWYILGACVSFAVIARQTHQVIFAMS